MAAVDSGLASVLDFAGTPTGAETTTSETTVDTSATTESAQIPNTQSTGADNAGTQDRTQPGSETSNNVDGTKSTATQGTEKPSPDKSIADALKSWREGSPEHAAIAKQLSDEHFRLRAYEQNFGSAAEARELRMFLNEAVGLPVNQRASVQQIRESIQQLQNFRTNVEDSDQLLYSGDRQVVENIVADLKESGHLDALGKLAAPFLESLALNDAAGYGRVASSVISSELRNANFVGVFNQAFKALQGGDVETAKESLSTIARWFSQVERIAGDAKNPKVDPERQAFLKEKETFEKNKVSEFRSGVATEADRSDNRSLGAALKAFLKTPFFKDFPRPSLVDLASSIKGELRSRLQGDKAYQTQMKAYWNSKTPAKARILEYHNAKVESIANDVVNTVVNRRYPTYSKGASAAAGRAAATQQKTTAEQQQNKQSVETGKPIYVAAKPKWDAIDWSKDPQQLLFIGGKAYLKGGKFVTWRK